MQLSTSKCLHILIHNQQRKESADSFWNECIINVESKANKTSSDVNQVHTRLINYILAK